MMMLRKLSSTHVALMIEFASKKVFKEINKNSLNLLLYLIFSYFFSIFLLLRLEDIIIYLYNVFISS